MTLEECQVYALDKGITVLDNNYSDSDANPGCLINDASNFIIFINNTDFATQKNIRCNKY